MNDLTADELRDLRRLHLSVGRRVDSLFGGEYRSAIRGQGMEFEEVRPYVPGDDVRHIDRNVLARTGEPFVKVFQEERQATILTLVDVSGSAGIGGGGVDGQTDRRRQIARVAGGIAYASLRNQDRVGLVSFSDRVESYLPPRRSRGHVWAVIRAAYQRPHGRRGTDLHEVIRFVQRVQRRRAVIVVISDFLDEGAWDRPFGALCRRHTVHAVVVDEPMDHDVRGLGLFRAVDAESGVQRWVDGAAWASVSSLDERRQRLRRCGARVLAMSTHDDPFLALTRHFHRLGERR